jgi:hypothetical protein
MPHVNGGIPWRPAHRDRRTGARAVEPSPVTLLPKRPPFGSQTPQQPPDVLVLMVRRRQLLPDHARRALPNTAVITGSCHSYGGEAQYAHAPTMHQSTLECAELSAIRKGLSILGPQTACRRADLTTPSAPRRQRPRSHVIPRFQRSRTIVTEGTLPGSPPRGSVCGKPGAWARRRSRRRSPRTAPAAVLLRRSRPWR